MKKILFPILTSVALVPTIAATSCGIYWVENITQYDSSKKHMTTTAKYSCSNEAGYEWIVDFNYWEDQSNAPKGIFQLTTAEHTGPSLNYFFGPEGKTTVYVDETPVDWQFGNEDRSQIKITDSVDLLNKIVKIKTSIIVVASETETYFSFEAW